MTTSFTIKYLTKCDDMGRCQFTLSWCQHYAPGYVGMPWMRTQVFFADPTSYGFPRP